MNLWRRLRRKRIPLSELKTADIMASKSSLEHSVDSWEAIAHVFTALVAIGLIIEYRDPFVSFWNTHDWSFITKAIGGVLVTLGVAGEFITGLRSTSKDGELREANSILASRAAETIAASNERIAELTAETARAKLALEQFKADRTISDEQQAHIIARLTPFRKQKYFLMVYPNPEALRLLTVIARILASAGWERVGRQLGTLSVDGPDDIEASQAYETGLAACTAADDHQARAALDALSDVLSAEGLPCRKFSHPDLLAKIPKAMAVVVGAKP